MRYAGVAVVDTDVCVHEDVHAWMRRLHRNGTYFAAMKEVVGRPHLGMNTHLMYLRPSRLLHRLLVDKARLGDFMPYTNGEQDVIETVFAPHLDSPEGLPSHTHMPADKDRGCRAHPRVAEPVDAIAGRASYDDDDDGTARAVRRRPAATGKAAHNRRFAGDRREGRWTLSSAK